MISDALMRISVGVAVERRTARSAWVDAIWRSVSVFTGVATADPWTIIESHEDVVLYYAGEAAINLFRTETAYYLENLKSGSPLLWVVLRPVQRYVGLELRMVTADPAEGEALTGAGGDLVDTVAMPESVIQSIHGFIREHHIERPTFKRTRDRTGLSPERADEQDSQP